MHTEVGNAARNTPTSVRSCPKSNLPSIFNTIYYLNLTRSSSCNLTPIHELDHSPTKSFPLKT